MSLLGRTWRLRGYKMVATQQGAPDIQFTVDFGADLPPEQRRAILAQMVRVANATGLPQKQAAVLEAIRSWPEKHPGWPISVRDIKDQIGVSHTTAYEAVDALLALGLIERSPGRRAAHGATYRAVGAR